MAVVERKRAHKTVFYVVFTWQRKRVWEHAGSDRREAERLDARRKREVKNGSYTPPAESRAITVGQFAAEWLAKRTNRSADHDRSIVSRHVLTRSFAELPIAETRPRHLIALIEELKRETKLSGKSIHNIWGALRTMYREATIRDLIASDPCVLPRGLIDRRPVKPRVAYERDEVEAVFNAPLPARLYAFATVLFLTGMRLGEVCGLRWGDVTGAAVTVLRQYDGQPLKTDRPRVVPVHRLVAAALDEYREEWRLVFCRQPGKDDVIFAGKDGTAVTRSMGYKLWRQCCAVAGVANRSVHSTRHTFITMARQAGAPKDVVERITHNATGDIVDRYTHSLWEPMVAAVAAITVDARRDPRRTNGSGGENGGSSGTSSTFENQKAAVDANLSVVRVLAPEPGNPPVAASDQRGSQRAEEASAGVWALALAAETVLRRRVFVVPGVVVGRKRVRDAG